MQFLSMSRRMVKEFGAEAFTPELAAAEAARVKELYAQGILRQVWLRGDTAGAAILWEAASEAEVRAAIESLPIYKAGMLDLTAFTEIKPYPGFAK